MNKKRNSIEETENSSRLKKVKTGDIETILVIDNDANPKDDEKLLKLTEELQTLFNEFQTTYDDSVKLFKRDKDIAEIYKKYTGLYNKASQRNPEILVGFFGCSGMHKSSAINYLVSGNISFPLPTSNKSEACTTIPFRVKIHEKTTYKIAAIEKMSKNVKNEIEFTSSEKDIFKEVIKVIQYKYDEVEINIPSTESTEEFEKLENDQSKKSDSFRIKILLRIKSHEKTTYRITGIKRFPETVDEVEFSTEKEKFKEILKLVKYNFDEIIINIPFSSLPKGREILKNVQFIDFIGYPDKDQNTKNDTDIIRLNSQVVKHSIDKYVNLDCIFFFANKGKIQIDLLRNMWKNNLFGHLSERQKCPSKLISIRFENEEKVSKLDIESHAKDMQKPFFELILTDEEGFDFDNSTSENKIINSACKSPPLDIDYKHEVIPKMIKRFNTLFLVESKEPNISDEAFKNFKDIIEETYQYKTDLLLKTCLNEMQILITELLIKCKSRFKYIGTIERRLVEEIIESLRRKKNKEKLINKLITYLDGKKEEAMKTDFFNREYDNVKIKHNERFTKENSIYVIVPRNVDLFCKEMVDELFDDYVSILIQDIIDNIKSISSKKKYKNQCKHIIEDVCSTEEILKLNLKKKLQSSLKIEELKQLLIELSIASNEECIAYVKERFDSMKKQMETIVDDISDIKLISENEQKTEIDALKEKLKKINKRVQEFVEINIPIPSIQNTFTLPIPKLYVRNGSLQIPHNNNKTGRLDFRIDLKNNYIDPKWIKGNVGDKCDELLKRNAKKSTISTCSKFVTLTLSQELSHIIEEFGFETIIQIEIPNGVVNIKYDEVKIKERINKHNNILAKFYGNESKYFENIHKSKDLALFPIFLLPTSLTRLLNESQLNDNLPLPNLLIRDLYKVGQPNGFMIFVLFECDIQDSTDQSNFNLTFYKYVLDKVMFDIKKYDHIKKDDLRTYELVPVILPLKNLGPGRIRKIAMLMAEHFNLKKYFLIDDDIKIVNEYNNSNKKMISYENSLSRALMYMSTVMIEGIKGNDHEEDNQNNPEENDHEKNDKKKIMKIV